MKGRCILLLLVCTFFVSCSHTERGVVNDFSLLSSDTLVDESVIAESDSLLSASYTNLDGASILEYLSSEIIVYYPYFENEFIDTTIKERINSYIDTMNDVSTTCFDFFVSRGQGAISIVFYDATSVSSSMRNVFAVTFSEELTSLLDIGDFIDAESPLEHISQTVDKLYGVNGAFKNNSKLEFYADLRGITVIDSLGHRYSIPRENFDGKASRKVTVGKGYTPVSTGEKVIALTFDDGPSYKNTAYLLSILKEKDVKATFFTVGYNIPGNEYLLRRMIDQGCDIGIHSYSHQNYFKMTREEVMEDIDKCAELIKNATDVAPYLIRAPFGNIGEEIVDEKEYYFINWCVDPYDWSAKTPEEVYDRVVEAAVSGSIVLLHDLYRNSCDATALIIDKLKNDGWRFVTISELFDLKNNSPSGEIYYKLGK